MTDKRQNELPVAAAVATDDTVLGFDTSTGLDVQVPVSVLDDRFGAAAVTGGYTYVQSFSVDGAPVDPSIGDTWFDPDVGKTYLRYNDGTTVWLQSGVAAASAADAGGVTNLTWTAATSVVASDTGTDATLTAVDGTNPGLMTVALKTKLDGIETAADVTDATNVAAAGSVMESDTTTAAMSFVVDEDAMSSNSATKLPTQQSVKAYVDAQVVSAGASISPFYVIAASNAPALMKAQANETLDGTADQVQIQAALDLGYPVLLTQGLFTVSAQINITSLGLLRGMGYKTVLRPATAYTTGDSCVIGSKNNSAVLWTIEDLAIDGAYRSVHGIRIYNTTQDTVDPPAPGSDNYGTIRNVFIEGTKGGGVTRGIWLDDNPDGLRTCQVFDVNMRACDTALEINSSDHIVTNLVCGADTVNGLVVTSSNNRFANIKLWFTQAFGVKDTGGRNTYVGCEVQDAIGVCYQFYGHETSVAGAFANIVSASRATTTAFDIWCEGSSFVGLNVQFNTGSSRTMDYAFDFNTSNNITVVGSIGNPETDFDNTDITGSIGTGSKVMIARVGDVAYTGPRTVTNSGTTHTLDRHDSDSIQVYSNASLCTITVPTNASDPIPVGQSFDILSQGAAGVTLSTAGLTLLGSPNKTIAQGEAMVLTKLGTDTWTVVGGTSA